MVCPGFVAREVSGQVTSRNGVCMDRARFLYRRPGDRSRRARKLAELFENLKDCGIKMTVTGAHGQVRDLLRAERLDGEIQGIARGGSLESELRACSDVIQPT